MIQDKQAQELGGSSGFIRTCLGDGKSRWEGTEGSELQIKGNKTLVNSSNIFLFIYNKGKQRQQSLQHGGFR